MEKKGQSPEFTRRTGQNNWLRCRDFLPPVPVASASGFLPFLSWTPTCLNQPKSLCLHFLSPLTTIHCTWRSCYHETNEARVSVPLTCMGPWQDLSSMGMWSWGVVKFSKVRCFNCNQSRPLDLPTWSSPPLHFPSSLEVWSAGVTTGALGSDWREHLTWF